MSSRDGPLETVGEVIGEEIFDFWSFEYLSGRSFEKVGSRFILLERPFLILLPILFDFFDFDTSIGCSAIERAESKSLLLLAFLFRRSLNALSTTSGRSCLGGSEQEIINSKFLKSTKNTFYVSYSPTTWKAITQKTVCKENTMQSPMITWSLSSCESCVLEWKSSKSENAMWKSQETSYLLSDACSQFLPAQIYRRQYNAWEVYQRYHAL